MNKTVFDYRDYKEYLSEILSTQGESRGRRSKLAKDLKCHTAYISQVLNGKTHFSLEHAIRISAFLGHRDDEKQYFLLLVHLGRAGSTELRAHYDIMIDEVHSRRQIIPERLQIKKSLSKEDRETYYSAWYYAATHILVTIPRYQSTDAIAEYLKLPDALVQKVAQFLVSRGLVIRNGDKLKASTARVHLGPDSPLISKHHTNWRMKAIQSLDISQKEDLHYSSVISLSLEDAKKIRRFMLELLEKTEPVLRASKEEAAFCMSLDFFKL